MLGELRQTAEKYVDIFEERLDYRFLTTFIPNKVEPIHRWYPYTEAFSKQLIVTLLKKYDIYGMKNKLVLDPFCGVGTTLLSCKQSGVASKGSDLVPLTVFVSEVKIQEGYDLKQLKEKIEEITNEPYSPPISKAAKKKIIYKAFTQQEINYILFFKEKINKVQDPKIQNFLKLGLLRAIGEISRAEKSGGWLRMVKKDNPPVRSVLKKYLSMMYKDLSPDLTTFINEKQNSVSADVYLCDARKLEYLDNSTIDFTITSPPYLNRHDYTQLYKIELMLMDFGDYWKPDWKELMNIRYQTLRSHVEAKYEETDNVKSQELKRILGRLSKKHLNNPRIPYMIKGYFEDMYTCLREIYRVTKDHGRVALVVGNVRFEEELIDVDALLADIGQDIGFTPERIIVTRYKGNSSQQMGKYGRIEVRESIVILRK